MTILQRLFGLLAKRRSIFAAGLCAAATAALLLAGHGANSGANAASAAAASYAALDSQEASGLTLVSSHSAAPAAGEGAGTPHPSWPAQAPEGAGQHWPDATTIRRLTLSVPGLTAWIAASLEGGICVLLYAGEPPDGNAAVYSSCSAEGRLDRGASLDVSGIPGKPGVTIDAGVVPDGVTAVTATLADGGSETLQVQDNAWARESDEPMAAGQAPAWTTGG